jgi:DNA polymerase III subunit gamma/tau
VSKQYISLYRRWRSQSLNEIIGQDFVVKTLTNALKNQKLAHAYLFSGPRGTGKTSLARILAKSVNCLEKGISPDPCQQCESCRSIIDGSNLDVVEIDAASNRGVDDIRQLRERVKFIPVKSLYKVYIIDEVHMLTGEAFNALLKTLEEPPEHVIFLMATTEPHKIPVTILSRVMRFDLKRIPTDKQVKLLRKIADAEKIMISDVALNKLAVKSNGSLRDSESMLDQISSFTDGEIESDDVTSFLGITNEEFIVCLLENISSMNRAEAIKMVRSIYMDGHDPGQIVNDLLLYIHILILKKLGVKTDELVSEYAVSKEIIDSSSSIFDFDQLRTLELTLRDASSRMKYSFSPLSEMEMTVMDLFDSIGGKSPKLEVKPKETQGVRQKNPMVDEKPKKPIAEQQESADDLSDDLLSQIIKYSKEKHIIIYAFLSRLMSAELKDDVIVLSLPHDAEFERNRLLEPETNKKLKSIIPELGVDAKGFRIELKDIGNLKEDKDIQSAAELFGVEIKE